MEFDHMIFHNVEEMEETEKGYLPRRIPREIRDRISTGVQENIYATGMELRFTMPEGSADIILRADMVPESATAHIFFGSFQGGWDQSSKNIYETETRIHIEYPEERKMNTCGNLRKSSTFRLPRRLSESYCPMFPVIMWEWKAQWNR